MARRLAKRTALPFALVLLLAHQVSSAPSALAATTRAIPPAQSADEALAERMLARWAPEFIQHVAPNAAGRDWPLAIDFDGDWKTTNNWRHQPTFAKRAPASVYGSAVLSEDYAYLTYVLYYPRDWQSGLCLPYLCHANDLEVVLVVASLDGRLVLIESKAHLEYRAAPGAQIARSESGRPLVSVESSGHGTRPCGLADDACKLGAGRLRYVPSDPQGKRKGRGAPSPLAARGQAVPYQLLSLADTLWARRQMDASGHLWIVGETGPLFYRGEVSGRMGHSMGASLAGSHFIGGVRPPWALRASYGERGDWFLDPAHTIPKLHPQLFKAHPDRGRYRHHPFQAALQRECVEDACSDPPRLAEATRVERWLGEAGIGALFAMCLVHARRRRRAHG